VATLIAVGGFRGLERHTYAILRPGPTILGFNLLWLGLVGLTAIEAGHPLLTWLRRPALRWLGQISYGLYLLHHVLLMFARDLNRSMGHYRLPNWMIFTTLVLSLVLAGLSYEFFEAPILRLKTRFRYTGGPPVERTPARPRAISSDAAA
jgi:peptidoglycan/LPS O-acetylase OafA/YrhL